MKTIYLKKNTTIGGQYFIKIIEHEPNNVSFIIIMIDNLQFEPNTENDFDTEVNWYKKEWNMVECDRQTFDDVYIKFANKINEVSKI